jgi:large subunit ribosomal protein L17
MRHRKSGRKLKRTSSHKKATLNALCTALIRSKRIRTTVAKAKETRMMIEKLITSAKNTVATEGDKKNVHARRMIARYIKDRQVVKELFGDVASKVANRNGGYTRIVKLGQRYGDSAEVAILELVDFNTEATAKKTASKDAKTKKKKEKKKAESEKVVESKQ